MEDEMKIIYDFLSQFEDFTQSDKESGYINVYRPGWHETPFQFWFNPPFDDSGKSNPVLSGTIILLEDNSIMVESMRDNLFYNINDCLGDSITSFILSLRNLNQ